MHKNFSPAAASLLTQLLKRNVISDSRDISLINNAQPEERLSDPNIIKRHEFFSGIDWVKLSKRELAPPFLLKLKGEDDVTFFDPVKVMKLCFSFGWFRHSRKKM